MKAKAYLVGAGPGDPGLLTLRAAEVLKKADLVVYDYLANPAHLKHAKPGAVKIGVGRGFRHKKISQDKINRMIVSAAKKGQTVVRLKGGDPYLFGRGGEEALFLKKHGIPFEVVPGVTSASACAAYAGIPLTHREHNASVTFLTGHRADDDNLDSIQWKKIVELGGTLVIYMGFYNLKKITSKLIQNGLLASTPAAVIEWGTLPVQRSAFGTISTISAQVSAKKMSAPVMIVIGDVVKLSSQLGWYEKLPLFGKKILLTRAQSKMGSLADRLTALGAHVLELPLIEIGPAKNKTGLDTAVQGIKTGDWIVFASSFAVIAWMRALNKNARDARALSGVKLAAVGPSSIEALEKFGLQADLKPESFEARALLEKFKTIPGGLREKRVFLPRTEIADNVLEKAFRGAGAEPVRVDAYSTGLPENAAADLKMALRQKFDWVTFTSSSTVEHFVKILGTSGARKAAKRMKFASIGPATTKALKKHGLRPTREAKIYSIEGLVNVLSR